MAKKSFYTSPIGSLKTESNRDHAGPEKILITVQGSILDAIMISSRPRNDPFSANYYFHHIGHRKAPMSPHSTTLLHRTPPTTACSTSISYLEEPMVQVFPATLSSWCFGGEYCSLLLPSSLNNLSLTKLDEI